MGMNIVVLLSAIGFALLIFPVHIYNYIYLNTAQKYASINVGIFKNKSLLNINTVKDKPGEMQINGRERKLKLKKPQLFYYRVFNSVYLWKIVQLNDFGVKNDSNFYLALAQSSVTYALYKFIEINGGNTKLRNYIILNEEHGDIRSYIKSVTIINMLVVAKIFILYLREKFR